MTRTSKPAPRATARNTRSTPGAGLLVRVSRTATAGVTADMRRRNYAGIWILLSWACACCCSDDGSGGVVRRGRQALALAEHVGQPILEQRCPSSCRSASRTAMIHVGDVIGYASAPAGVDRVVREVGVDLGRGDRSRRAVERRGDEGAGLVLDRREREARCLGVAVVDVADGAVGRLHDLGDARVALTGLRVRSAS